MKPLPPRAALLGRFRGRLQEGQKALRERYLADGDAVAMLAGRSALIDDVLAGLWREQRFPADLALVAVGGYGRGELYPASDIDLLILLPGEPDAALKAQLEEMVGLFWDIGLEIGHSVRTPDECLAEAAGDITIQTALIEARLLTGNGALFDGFFRRLRAALDPQAFFKAKRIEQDERYLRFQDTPFSLEPNIKESPGGLRDLQVILWITQATGLGRSWRDLEDGGFVTAEEREHLERCEASLQRLRIRLHYHLNRREDRLLFDYQTALAEQLGFRPTATRRASEMLMQDYYRNAKSVTQLNVILLQNLGAAIFPPPDQAPRIINERFQAAHEMLDVRDEQVFERHPPAILESFLLLEQDATLKGMTARTLRALFRARKLIDDRFRADPANRALFLQIFQQPRGLVHELRRMNQYGILGRYLPNFGAIVGQMQHDLFHVYTVDQHILMVVRNLRRFTMEEFAHEYPFCTRLISEFDRHWLLYVAALFHDIAKGRGGDHSEQGTADAQAFCDSHGIAGEDAELVVWLVRRHLTMSQVAQKQDVSDPEVVAAFAAIVGDERHLTALYLLTVADIRGTSPKVWNSWKGQLLQDLYSATRRQLRDGGAAPAPHGVIQERQDEAMRLLRYFALSATVHERLWKQLDTVYFLRHSAEEIAWHTRCLHYRPNDEKPVVKARLNPASEGLQVMVYTRDQRDLFARLVGFFARAGYNIVDAKIHTTQHGYALDSFVLLDTSGRDNDREMLSYIEHELIERLTLQTAPEAPLAARLSRRLKHFPIAPSVAIEADEKGANYVLSLVAADRPGLLYAVATTLAKHGASLHTAKIATLGERAEDTFLISGGDLGQSAGRIRLESELLEQLKI
ncbi:[protein-PII] uridylyltransferase [Azospira restricta]|uniref:Bifunctional uridylyltransferase/uridylyl-removing enzyme n=1 Tax=Azospira restricta TaxID=404405 RepID=A0A974PWU8_9RHOO|nr:[protein-PII] uridylyltransferase [Azospira restricta]QRJ62704.1 [protein-PII] uridylyltransferase [Azospira restricta]